MMKQIDQNIWVKDSYFLALGCKGSTRMTIVKTEQGLLIHSPVELSDADIEQINTLGNVSHIVAPNLFHHMHFAACANAFPQATCWAAQGLQQKIDGLPTHKILDSSTPIFPADQLQQIEIGGHKLNETAFFHRASSTLITADFLYNYRAEQYKAEKLFFFLLGCYGRIAVPFYHFFSITNNQAFLHSLETIINLPIKRIIMSHGRIVENQYAADLFQTAWAKFLNRHN